MEVPAQPPAPAAAALADIAVLPLTIWDRYGQQLDKDWLRRFNVLLVDKVMFTDGGIVSKLEAFCEKPDRNTWQQVKDAIDHSQIVVEDLHKLMLHRGRRFFSEHPKS